MKKPDLHLELTTKCLLKCHACPRTEYIDKINNQELSLDAIKNIVNYQKEYCIISLCGDHGDPIYHSKFHDVIELLHSLPNSPTIMISTNGSGRDSAWWHQTAKQLRKRDKVIFGIDGLENTNHIYRKGARWANITKAIKILKQYSDCKLIWQWILFKYNEHQLACAKKLYTELGFHEFWLVNSSRHNDPYEDECFKATKTLDEAWEVFRDS